MHYSTLNANLEQILTKIKTTAQNSQYKQDVNLIAVSKTFSSNLIQELYDCGQRNFGESYINEFIQKANKLLHLDIVWHFIGNLQSNKIKKIANLVSYVHSIEKESQVILLSKYRDVTLPKLNCLIQINLNDADTRRGVNLTDIDKIIRLANFINDSPNLIFCGLMGIASNTTDTNLINSEFNYLHNLFTNLKKNYFSNIYALSMGMSEDFIPAILHGATHVRIGSKIFGKRV